MRQLIEVGVLATLLVAALIASYVVYYETDDVDKGDGTGVAVYVANKTDVTKVTYAAEDQDVVIERKTDDAGDYLWVTVTARTEAAPAPTDDDSDDTDVDAVSPIPIVTETVTAFVGNDEATKLFEEFAPFQADRALVVSDREPQDFGFDEPFGTITVDRKAGPVTLTIGGATYGDRSRYLKSGDNVYLVAKRIFTRMGSAATSLPERRLSPLQSSDVRQISLTIGEVTRTFVHVNADDRVKAFWADAATPDKKDDVASSWADVAVALSAKAYVSEPPASLVPIATLALAGTSDTWDIIVLSDGATPPTHYARSAFNRGLVTLTASQAEDLVAELPTLIPPVTPVKPRKRPTPPPDQPPAPTPAPQ